VDTATGLTLAGFAAAPAVAAGGLTGAENTGTLGFSLVSQSVSSVWLSVLSTAAAAASFSFAAVSGLLAVLSFSVLSVSLLGAV
jgi:hypothetical protein